jgi:hypothetical protein
MDQVGFGLFGIIELIIGVQAILKFLYIITRRKLWT